MHSVASITSGENVKDQVKQLWESNEPDVAMGIHISTDKIDTANKYVCMCVIFVCIVCMCVCSEIQIEPSSNVGNDQTNSGEWPIVEIAVRSNREKHFGNLTRLFRDRVND